MPGLQQGMLDLGNHSSCGRVLRCHVECQIHIGALPTPCDIFGPKMAQAEFIEIISASFATATQKPKRAEVGIDGAGKKVYKYDSGWEGSKLYDFKEGVYKEVNLHERVASIIVDMFGRMPHFDMTGRLNICDLWKKLPVHAKSALLDIHKFFLNAAERDRDASTIFRVSWGDFGAEYIEPALHARGEKARSLQGHAEVQANLRLGAAKSRRTDRSINEMARKFGGAPIIGGLMRMAHSADPARRQAFLNGCRLGGTATQQRARALAIRRGFVGANATPSDLRKWGRRIVLVGIDLVEQNAAMSAAHVKQVATAASSKGGKASVKSNAAFAAAKGIEGSEGKRHIVLTFAGGRQVRGVSVSVRGLSRMQRQVLS